MLAFYGSFSRKCLEGISFNFLYVLSSIDQKEVRQRKITSVSNVLPELKQNPSLLRISCQCLMCKELVMEILTFDPLCLVQWAAVMIYL